jgi:hypothetical protein
MLYLEINVSREGLIMVRIWLPKVIIKLGNLAKPVAFKSEGVAFNILLASILGILCIML